MSSCDNGVGGQNTAGAFVLIFPIFIVAYDFFFGFRFKIRGKMVLVHLVHKELRTV